MGKKSNSRRKPSVKFWLLTLAQNQVLRLAMLKTTFRWSRRRKKKRKRRTKNSPSNNNKQQQQSSCNKCRLRTWGPPRGMNTNIQPFML
jgi:hypothetical protein